MSATLAVDFYREWNALMRSWGHTVVEVDGCESRTASARAYDPRGGFFEHHDASSRLSGNWGSLPSIIAGRKGSAPVPGPLSNLQFARDGQVALVAVGTANHGGVGGPRGALPANDANRFTCGAEVANDGLGEAYSPELTRALIHGEAAWAIVAGRTAEYVIGHKEWTNRKIDPLVDMNLRRAAVAAVIANRGPQQEDDFMALFNNIEEFQVAVNRAVLCRTPADREGAWLWDRVAGIDDKTGAVSAVTVGPLSEFGGRNLPQALAYLFREDGSPLLLAAARNEDPAAFVEAMRPALTEVARSAVAAAQQAGASGDAEEIAEAVVARMGASLVGQSGA